MNGSAPLGGYYYQNCVAALKIIDCLFFKSDISSVVLENYYKGEHIDDIIIYRKAAREYYQVKWSDDTEKSYTLYSLLNSGDPLKKSILKQLAEGYLTAKQETGSFTVTLFTTKQVSSQKRPSDGITLGLADFIKDVINPLQGSIQTYDLLPIYAIHKDLIEKVKLETSLDKDTFNDFLKTLKFNFDSDSIKKIQEETITKFINLGIETNLYDTFINSVVKWSISGEKISKDKVLEALGLQNRLEDKISQFFKVVDDAFYVPNSDLYNKINTALNELKGGYIFIEGLPGIGKSTALTKYREINDDILFTYYCFIPDNTEFGKLRNKSEYFLRAMCVAIEHSFDEIDLPLKYSDHYEEKLTQYIQTISKLNRKAVFIVDGLDHVHRDLAFQDNSLLNYIKGELPDNVFFLLSSQYTKVLSTDVLLTINSDSRRHIVVEAFNQTEIERYLKNKGIEADDLLDKIEQTSNGIPLYLHYISELFLEATVYQYSNLLDQLPKLTSGSINSYHEFLYAKIESKVLSKWILSLLAFRREPIDVLTVKEILTELNVPDDVVQIEETISTFSHLLRKHDGRSFSIFHNSFREFIIGKNLDNKKQFNQAIASYYEKNPNTDEAYRNYLKHLFEIGEYEKVLNTVTIDWVRNAWNNYRSIDEISENIQIAWEAAAEVKSLSQFTRISFIKAQIGRLSYNMQTSEVGFPSLFLYAGLDQQSIRCIWNGDYVTIQKVYFAKYLCRYYKFTGNLLPGRIISQGYSKQASDKSLEDITSVFKGESLFNPETKELFDKIRSIEWKDHHDVNSDFLRKKKTPQDNHRINLEIQLDIIQFLFEVKKFDSLCVIEKEFRSDPIISTYSRLALAKILLPSSRVDAMALLKQVDFEVSDNVETSIAYISDYLSNEEVTGLIKYKPELPEFQTQVVDKKSGHYRIDNSFVEFLNKLKCIWVISPELISQAILKVSALDAPARNLYDFSLFVAEAWSLSRKSPKNESAIFELLIKAMKSVNVPSSIIISRERHSENYGEHGFISRSIYYLHGQLFDLACKTLDKDLLKNLIEQWLQLDSEKDGYSTYYCHLEIAKTIQDHYKTDFREEKRKLIVEAERRVRLGEETATLIDELGEVAQVYGLCAFTNEFEIIYRQLFDIGFGLGSRKDYQAELIISPLKQLHKIDKENSLMRLQEVFEVQRELLEAGNGRMGHICLSNLMAFAIKDFPQLGFQLIDFEESNIARQETVQIVLNELFSDVKPEYLPYYWALVNTVSKWERENYFFDLSISLLYEAIKFKNQVYIRIITESIKRHLIVENKDQEHVKRFLKVIENEGITLSGVLLTAPLENAYPKPPKDKFRIWKRKWTIDDLIATFNINYSEFTDKISNELLFVWQDSTNKKIRAEYHRSRYMFRQFFDQLVEPNKIAIEKNSRKIIRAYLSFKNKILAFGKTPSYSQVESEFDVFLYTLKTIVPDQVVDDFIENQFEKEKWIDSFISLITGFTRSLLEEIMSEEETIEFCTKVSILNYENVLEFISTRLFGEIRSICQIKIAERIISIDPFRAKKILIELAGGENDRLVFKLKNREELPVGYSLVKAMAILDSDFTKKFLFKSYISQKGRYSFNVVSDLDELFFYSEIFNDTKALQTYYESNLAYNKGLAAGLPPKGKYYDFISTHEEKLSFQEVCVQYITSLFKYPIVKVRIMAIRSLVSLVKDEPSSIDLIIKYGIKQNNLTQIEYTLTLLQAIALIKPELVIPFKKDLWALFNFPHFNVNEQTKELLLILNTYKSDFLSSVEIEFISRVNQKSPLQTHGGIIHTLTGRNFIFSKYQSSLISPLMEHDQDETLISDDVYYDLSVTKGFNNHSGKNESVVHERYNINSNFDLIEINTAYVDETQDSINKVYYSKIKKACYNEEFVNGYKYRFRLFDPSYFLHDKIKRPEFINWVPAEITEEDFNNFTDLKSTFSSFLSREEEFITIYENGSQRPSEDYPPNELSTYFEIIAYAVKKDLPKIKEQTRLLPYVYSENIFLHSLSTVLPPSSDFPEKDKVIPIVGVSYNKFRGENDYSNAITLPDINSALGIDCSRFHLDLHDITDSLQILLWQNTYSTGRRRYKPTSEGVTLKIKKELLLNHLSEKGLELRFQFKLRRSCDKYKPEPEMHWFTKSGSFNYK